MANLRKQEHFTRTKLGSRRHLGKALNSREWRSRRLLHPLESLEPRCVLTSGVVISEFVASNDSTLDDSDGNSSDWLELFNSSSEAIDLEGWFLTDDEDSLDKWTFPSTTLDSGDYLTVFASGKDRATAGSELHTNFRLSTGGEFLALVEPDGQTIAHAYAPFPVQFTDVSYGLTTSTLVNTLVDENSTSSVLLPSSENDLTAETWTAPTFDDASWGVADSQLGYSDGPLSSLISEAGNLSAMVDQTASAYVRIPFDVDENYDELALDIQYDDGFAAYLNGTQVATRNAPDTLDADATARIARGGVITSVNLPILLEANVLQAVGDSQIETDRVQITEATPTQAGAVWTTFPITFGSRFSFSASMQLDVTRPGGASDADGEGGHGMTFVLQSGGPFRLGGSGGDLGLDNAGMQFVAIEFDAWSDGSFDPDSSLPSHIGVNTSLDGNVARVSVPRFNDSETSAPRFVWVEYDGALQQMEIYWSSTDNRPATPTLTTALDLPTVFADASNLWAGWTGSTGDDTWNQHEVLDFELTTFEEPAFDVETIDLSEHVDLLRQGDNVLAIHGLNASADDEDFLVHPKLIATKRNHIDLQAPGYLEETTPGEANSGTTQAPAAAVSFSLTGRTFVEPFDLVLTAGDTNAVIRYTTDGTIPNESSQRYSDPLRISSSSRIRARAFELNKDPGPVTSHGYIQIASDLQNFEGDVFDSNLPLMVFHSFGGDVHGNANSLVPVSSVFINNDQGRAGLLDEPEFAGRAGLRIRGQSSQGWPKKQYALEIWEEGNSDRRPISASRADDRSVSIFGLPEESDWVLNGPYSDKTQLNNFLTFNWSRAMGLYAPRTRLVEVFVKTNATGALNYRTDYRGTYVLLEKIKIDPSRVDIVELSPDATEEPEISGGYIWKYDKDGAGDVNFTTTFQSRTGSGRPWKFVEPERPPTVQRNWLINHLREFETALYGRNFTDPDIGYAKYIDVDSWIDTWLQVELTKNIDGFRLSTYYHKDRNGKIHQGPAWDYNLSLANANYLRGAYPTGWYSNSLSRADYPYWDRLFDDPNFELRVRDRWFELRNSIFSTDALLADIDDAVSQLTDGNPNLGVVAPGEPSNPISRNFDRWRTLSTYLWPNCFFGTGDCPTSPLPTGGQPRSYADYIFIMKDFVEERAAWIDRQFRTPPALWTTIQADDSVQVTLAATSSGTVYYTTDGSDPRDPSTGNLSPNAVRYQQPFIVSENTLVRTRSRSGTRWSAQATENFVLQIPTLAVSEIHYNPSAPSSTEVIAGFSDNEDFEFLELMNFGDSTIRTGGMRFDTGIEVTLDDVEIAPGDRVVVVRNADAFRARYGDGSSIVGEYGDSEDAQNDFRLSNAGERIRLTGALGETIVDYAYDDGWHPLSDGEGFSLARTSPGAAASTFPANDWRPSEFLHGSPGAAEPELVPGPNELVINEVLSLASGHDTDAIELWNRSDTSINLDGYLLVHETDRRIQIPLAANLRIAPQSYLVLDRQTLGANFRLSESGGTLSLRGATANGELTGYFDQVEYGPAVPNQSWGRVDTTAAAQFALQKSLTPNVANAGPVIGPIVINEVHYHPASGDSEFIELRNISQDSVNLATWQLTDGIQFQLPDVSLTAGEFLLLVQAPADASQAEFVSQWRATNTIPNEVLVLPYTANANGSLNNDGESLVLARTIGDDATDILEVDVVDYDDLPPWVPRADGQGPSLGRMDGLAFANDPANWASSSVGGTPGQENAFEDPTPPSVPKGLAVALLNDGMIGLGWHASSDPESRVDHYTIYRNGRVAGTSSIPFFRDSLVGSDEPVEYSVRAVNPDGFESELSNAVSIQFSTTTFQEGTAGYRGAADSRIRQGSPDLQEGDSRRMGLDGNAMGESGLAASTLLRWSDLDIPAENRLLGATISLNVVNPGDAFEFRPILTPWEELEVTWNQAADGRTWQAAGASGSLDRGDVIGLFEPNVRGIVHATLDAAGLEVLQGWLDTPSSNYGVILADPGGSTDSVTMDSSQSPSTELRPKLTLLHTDAARPLTGDINLDGSVNSRDLDTLHAAIQDASGDLHFDVDSDGNVNQQDVDALLAQLGTLRGDANLDGDVNFADFLLLSANFGRTQASWEQGDANGDREINFADFLLLSSNFGRTRQ